jgi:hypothetical protein
MASRALMLLCLIIQLYIILVLVVLNVVIAEAALSLCRKNLFLVCQEGYRVAYLAFTILRYPEMLV